MSPEEGRRLRSLLCGLGSARLSGRTTGGGVVCLRGASCVTRPSRHDWDERPRTAQPRRSSDRVAACQQPRFHKWATQNWQLLSETPGGGGGGGGGSDCELRRCLCRYHLKSRSYSTGALDDQQLLAIEGSKKVAARRALDVQVDGVRKRSVKRVKNPFPTATAIK